MKNVILLLVIFFLITGFSCKNSVKNTKTQPEGGPCSYNTRIIPAEVIEVYQSPSDTTSYDVWFVIKNKSGIPIQAEDTFIYSIHSNQRFISSSDIRKHDIKPGKIVQYKVMHIIEGSCTDYIEQMTLDKYEE